MQKEVDELREKIRETKAREDETRSIALRKHEDLV